MRYSNIKKFQETFPKRLARPNLFLMAGGPYRPQPSRCEVGAGLKARPRLPLELDILTRRKALNLPGYRLHPLEGDLKGFRSVTVRANWRIIFLFQGSGGFDVELIDYH